MTTFVLVHGAFRGGWAWDPVRRRLAAAGHDVLAPSLTGMGDRAHLRPSQGDRIRLSTWVEDVVSLVHSHDLRDIVLVGHSQGGLVTTAAATPLSDRIERLVFLDAPVPQNGERGIDLNPVGVPTPSVEDVDLNGMIAPRAVHPGTGMSDALAGWMNERLCPTPVGPSFDRVGVSEEASRLPHNYVFFAATPRSYPCWTTRMRLDNDQIPYREITGGHDTPLADPETVAAALIGRGER